MATARRSGMRRIGLRIGLPIALVGLLAWWNWPDSDPQGGASTYCDNFEGKPVANAAGWTVTWHQTACTTLGTDMGAYIYVHPTGSWERRRALVLRYDETGLTDAEPEITWTSNTSLLIKVRHVGQISKLVEHIDGIDVRYMIGKEDYPRAIPN